MKFVDVAIEFSWKLCFGDSLGQSQEMSVEESFRKIEVAAANTAATGAEIRGLRMDSKIFFADASLAGNLPPELPSKEVEPEEIIYLTDYRIDEIKDEMRDTAERLLREIHGDDLEVAFIERPSGISF